MVRFIGALTWDLSTWFPTKQNGKTYMYYRNDDFHFEPVDLSNNWFDGCFNNVSVACLCDRLLENKLVASVVIVFHYETCQCYILQFFTAIKKIIFR